MKVSIITLLVALTRAQEDSFACEVTDDCMELNTYFICTDVPEGETRSHGQAKECMHKGLFPLYPKEWIGTFVFSIIMLLSNVAGIGGGGVAIPLAMYFFNLSMKPAIAISSFSIACATVTRYLYNWKEKHPEKPNSTSIDYGMATVMMPLTLIGSLIGAYIYKSFPDMILLIILTLLLFFLSIQSMKKSFTIRQKEIDAESKKKAEIELSKV